MIVEVRITAEIPGDNVPQNDDVRRYLELAMAAQTKASMQSEAFNVLSVEVKINTQQEQKPN